MRVAVVHGLKPGGAARRLGGTVAHLSKLGWDVQEFVLGDAVRLTEQAVVGPWVSRADHVPSAKRPLVRYQDTFRLRRTWADVWDVVDAWRPDVIYMNPCAEPTGAPPGSQRAAAPILYYCDEPRRVDYERSARRQSRWVTRVPYYPMRRIQRRDERASLSAAAELLTNSEFTAQRIQLAYGRTASVVSPGIDEIFQPAAWTSPGQAGHVMSVGSLIPSKGHDLVIQAVSLANIGRKIVVVAPREDRNEEKRLQHLAETVGVALKFEIAVDDARLIELYRSAWLTMYLAREEPLGLVSMESQACGTPVVVSDEGGLPETILRGETGVAVSRDVEDASRVLRDLEVHGVRDAMAEAASRRKSFRASDSAAIVAQHLVRLAGGSS